MANIKCDNCGYNNHEKKIKQYGTCLRCKKVINHKAKYRYEMYIKLHLWSNKKTRNIFLKGV